VVTEGNADQRGQVEDLGASLHRRADTVGVRNVTGKDFDLVQYLRGQRIHPAPAVEGVVMHEGPHAMPATNKLLHQMTPNEAAGAGYEEGFFC
jgi:hypothetical protein